MGFGAKILAILLSLAVALLYTQYRSLSAPAPKPYFDVDAYWGAGAADNYKEDTQINQFTLDYGKPAGPADAKHTRVIAELVADLKRPLRLTAPLEGVGFEYGVNSVALQEMVRYWRDDYLPRWAEREKYMNQFPQFTTQIQGLNIHYIHAKPTNQQSSSKRVVPLLLLHGWPGSVREFYEIIPKLTDDDALNRNVIFEVIVPSLPGYGWSQGASKTGFGIAEMSIVLRNLMIRLGHEQFIIQGGDWGSALGAAIATLFPDNVLGYHSNMCFTNSPLSNLKAMVASLHPTSFVDAEHLEFFFPRMARFAYLIEESGYMHLQATKPDTIGSVLAHNPVGLLAYIFEKFSTWTKTHYRQLPMGGWEHYDTKFRDAILDNIMIYYLTNSITTSQRLYAEAMTYQQMGYQLDRVPTTVPTGCARFKYDLAHAMDWQLREKFVNLVHSTYHTNGGHFAALEQAQLLYEDFVQFVHKVL